MQTVQSTSVTSLPVFLQIQPATSVLDMTGVGGILLTEY